MKTKLAQRTGLGVLGIFAIWASIGAAAETRRGLDVQAVEGELARAGSPWKAGRNWLTDLSEPELRRLMGAPDASAKEDLAFEGINEDKEAPGAVDWRSKDGVGWLGPVMNQGNCGSCVAFAAVATLEAQTSISAGLPWLRPSYSPQMLFSCGGGSCDRGWVPASAARYLSGKGLADEACMPYTSGSTGDDVACGMKCADWAVRSAKTAGTSTPRGSIDAVKAALRNGPLMTTLTVYADFVAYAGGVYKHVTGGYLGGHAVSLVGYDDAKRAWLIRNSWGTEWGEQGFGWVSWDDRSGVGNANWGFQTRQAQGSLSVVSPSDRAYVAGPTELVAKAQGVMSVGESIRFQLRGTGQAAGDGITVACAALTADGCTAPLDTRLLRDGRYEVFAEGGAGPTTRSQMRELFILNSEPELKLSFKPAAGVDLNRPLTDRPEFEVEALSSGGVPIQRIEFRAIDASGRVVAVKGNDQVLERMKMGWRVATVPNGPYRILFHGETRVAGRVYEIDSNAYNVTVKH